MFLRPRAGLLPMLLLLSCGTAHAQIERCVRNVAEFNSAWLIGRDDPVVIKMATGTYDMADSVVAQFITGGDGPDNDIVVRGGYNANCSAIGEDPGATVLTHRNGGSLFLDNTNSESSGALTIERLTFRGISEVRIWIEGSLTADQLLRLSRVWFDQGGRLTVGEAAEVYIDNSLFTRSGDCALHMSRAINYFSEPRPVPSYFERGVVRNSTFADNAGRGLCVGQAEYEDDDWRVTLVNNVFWGNAGADIRFINPDPDVTTIDAVLRNNTYTLLETNRSLRQAPSGTSSANPQFVNAAAGNWRLGGASPAINSGRTDSALLTQKDFDGNVRWFGAAPDRGAFESNIGSTATVLTVTNINDSGIGSLRQALIDANAASNPNRIHFAIGSSCGPRVITLASLLPDIIHPVVIDGYTQPGASRNTAVIGNNATLCVAINGANQITGAYGLNINTNADPDATVSIEGIAFGGHSLAAVQFAGGRDHRLAGVQVGGALGAVNLLPSAIGVRVAGNTEGVRIGGNQLFERNVIADATAAGISISGSGTSQPSLALVENNYVGTLTGGDLRGNEAGIVVRGYDNTLRGNVIANSATHGIDLDGQLAIANRVQDNKIGVPALCVGNCNNRGNGGHGIRVRNGADGNRITGNTIAWNGLDGIAVISARENTIRQNTFFENIGIGIDLGDNGRDYFNANNSVLPPAGSGNDAQNSPGLTLAAGSTTDGFASGSLTSRNGHYRIDFYATTTCTPIVIGGIPLGSYGQGRDWVGAAFVQISNGSPINDGTGSFASAPIARAGSPDYFATPRQIMATATRLSGSPLLPGAFRELGTSEFSRCRAYTIGIGDRIFADDFED